MRIQPIDASAFNELAATTTAGNLPFGKVFTPHMVSLSYNKERGWHDGQVVLRKPLSMDPAAMCFHYGQTVFEGLKAHRQDNGQVVIFRAAAHAQRMQRSCTRLCMPPVDQDVFIQAVEALVTTEYSWVPAREGTSLYLRPTMIATEPALGVRASASFQFFVLATATGPYFASGFSGIRVAVEKEMCRAAPGGLGSAKTGANYVASMFAADRAKQRGCDQVLWLDAVEHRWLEETGASNIFWVEDGNKIGTPPLSDSILGGITRDSLLQLAPRLDIQAEERPMSIEELVTGIRSGRITEVFGSGTAAVVTPVAELSINNEIVRVGDGKPGKVSRRLLETVTAIHRGRFADPANWCTPIARPSWGSAG